MDLYPKINGYITLRTHSSSNHNMPKFKFFWGKFALKVGFWYNYITSLYEFKK